MHPVALLFFFHSKCFYVILSYFTALCEWNKQSDDDDDVQTRMKTWWSWQIVSDQWRRSLSHRNIGAIVALSWRVQFIGPHSCWTHLQTQLLGSVTVRIVTSKLKVRNKDEWLEDVTYPLQRLHSLSIVCSAETYETDRLPVVSIAAITTAKHVHFISRKLIVNATFVAMLPFSKELHLT